MKTVNADEIIKRLLEQIQPLERGEEDGYKGGFGDGIERAIDIIDAITTE